MNFSLTAKSKTCMNLRPTLDICNILWHIVSFLELGYPIELGNAGSSPWVWYMLSAEACLTAFTTAMFTKNRTWNFETKMAFRCNTGSFMDFPVRCFKVQVLFRGGFSNTNDLGTASEEKSRSWRCSAPPQWCWFNFLVGFVLQFHEQIAPQNQNLLASSCSSSLFLVEFFDFSVELLVPYFLWVFFVALMSWKMCIFLFHFLLTFLDWPFPQLFHVHFKCLSHWFVLPAVPTW